MRRAAVFPNLQTKKALMKTARWFATLSLVGVGLLGLSCGDDREPGGGLTAETYPQLVLEAQCAYAFRCCDLTDREIFANGAPTEAECRLTLDDMMLKLDKFLDARAETGHVSFDAARAAEVIAGVRDFPCGAGKPLVEMKYQRVYNGTLAEGASCTEREECMRPVNGVQSCDEPSPGEPGVCVVTFLPERGEDCLGQCADDLDCNESSICVTRSSFSAVGEYCNDEDDCVSRSCDFAASVCEAPDCPGLPGM
jgi:hypothetical protein